MDRLTILVVEDEFLLACSLEDDLADLGHTMIGPFADLAAARDGVRRHDFDLAILDINLSGEMVFPLADELAAAGRPFMFLSGYARSDIPERFRGYPHVAKPYAARDLGPGIARALRHAGR